MTVGMERMPNIAASCWCLSTSTLPRRNAPLYSAASFSSIGPSVLQGPHHSAQKSIRMGVSSEACSTSVSKLSWPTSKTWEGAVVLVTTETPRRSGTQSGRGSAYQEHVRFPCGHQDLRESAP